MQTIRKFQRPSKARSAAASQSVADAIKAEQTTERNEMSKSNVEHVGNGNTVERRYDPTATFKWGLFVMDLRRRNDPIAGTYGFFKTARVAKQYAIYHGIAQFWVGKSMTPDEAQRTL